MIGSGMPCDETYPPLRTRLKYAVVPVTVLMGAYFASTGFVAMRERTETLERLPARPALRPSAQTLGPVLDAAMASVREAPTAENVGRLGKLYHANQYDDEAARCYRRAMELEPREAAWPYLLAMLLQRTGDADDVAALRGRAVELGATFERDSAPQGLAGPGDVWAAALIPFCHDTELLLLAGQRASLREQWDEAMACFKRVQAIAPDNFDAARQLGDVLQKQLRFAEAGAVLLAALALDAPGDAQIAHLNCSLGDNYLWQQMAPEAVPHYEAALALDPDLAAAHQGLAECFLALDRLEDSISHSKAAAALNPASGEAQYNWGRGLVRLDRLEEALPHFAEAARLNPTMPPADYMAGAFYFKRGNMAEAAPYLERALEASRKRGNHRLAAQIKTMLGK